MTKLWLSASFWVLANITSAAEQVAAAVPLYTDQNVPPAIYEKMLKSQDLALDLQYERAEAELRIARAAIPDHPLGGVFLLAIGEFTRQSQRV